MACGYFRQSPRRRYQTTHRASTRLHTLSRPPGSSDRPRNLIAPANSRLAAQHLDSPKGEAAFRFPLPRYKRLDPGAFCMSEDGGYGAISYNPIYLVELIHRQGEGTQC